MLHANKSLLQTMQTNTKLEYDINTAILTNDKKTIQTQLDNVLELQLELYLQNNAKMQYLLELQYKLESIIHM